MFNFIASLFSVPAYSPNDPLNPFWDAVKLVRAGDLKTWNRFKHYDDHESITYLRYKKEVRRIAELRRKIPLLLKARDRIDELNRDELKEYKTEVLKVPRSFRRHRVRMALPKRQYPQTVYKTSSEAEVVGDVLIVKAKWTTQEICVRMSCPARILHADEIAEKQAWLDTRSSDEKGTLRDIETSWSSHPVLFISHRWETLEHPDPNGSQLAKLSQLTNCFIIYDYSSFPQDRSSIALDLILRNMTRLLNNVVVLASSDYLDRGWCLYEYIVASMRVNIVCDEVNDPDFVKLREWSSTKPPVSLSLKGHSFESNLQNTINKSVIETVNRIRPKYAQSSFTVEADRTIVTGLLIDDLMDTLPNRKEYPSPYLGEWVSKNWKREELAAAFTEHMDWEEMKRNWEHLGTVNMRPNKLGVPTTIEEAVRRGYLIERPPPISETDGLLRVFEGLMSRGASPK